MIHHIELDTNLCGGGFQAISFQWPLMETLYTMQNKVERKNDEEIYHTSLRKVSNVACSSIHRQTS